MQTQGFIQGGAPMEGACQDWSRSHTPFYCSNRTKSCPKYIYDRTKVYILGGHSQFPDIQTGEAANTGIR